MKKNCRSSSRCQITVQGLLLGFILLAWGSVNAQNFVKNPDFEEELGPDNWTIVYAYGGPNDLFIKDRTRLAHKDLVPGTWDADPPGSTNFLNRFGLHFKAGHDWKMHAYASQIITNLTPGTNYTASAWITQFEGPSDKVQIYMELLGGPNGTV